MEEYIQHLDDEGEKPVHYRLGNLATDGHTNDFYLRDWLPRATSTDSFPGDLWPHAHSIVKGPGNTLVCEPAGPNQHIHTGYVIIKAE